MNRITEKIRYILQYYYDQGDSVSEACEKICAVYGYGTVSESIAHRWFAQFSFGDFNVKEEGFEERLITESVDEIVREINKDRHISTRDIALNLNIDHETVLNHLQTVGYEKKLDIWVPLELTKKNLLDRISICEALKKRNEIEPFLGRLIIGDERWIRVQDNENTSPNRSCMKPKMRPKKLMLSIWWDLKGIIYFEVLPPGQMIDSSLYCEQLTRLKQAIEEKRPELSNREGIVFHHDYTRPYKSMMTHRKLREFGWEVLIHPPYSPDLAPSDYHLFPFLQNFLNNLKLTSQEDCENHLFQFISTKTQSFYTDGMIVLPQKWQKVINQNGAYLV